MTDQTPRVVFLGPLRAEGLAIACKVGRRVAARTSAPVLCIHDLAPTAGLVDGSAGSLARLSFLQAVHDVMGPGGAPGYPPVLILEADNIHLATLGFLRPYLADPAA